MFRPVELVVFLFCWNIANPFFCHTEQRPLPGYVMTVAKDGAKLAEAKDPTAPPECHSAQDKATPGQAILTCTSETITQFLSSFGGIYPHPVIDRTGLTKSYDFTLKFFFTDLRTRDDYIHLYTEAFNKQLGLVVRPETCLSRPSSWTQWTTPLQTRPTSQSSSPPCPILSLRSPQSVGYWSNRDPKISYHLSQLERDVATPTWTEQEVVVMRKCDCPD
jgi:Protein of unknown function (DUF3738)